MRRLVRARLSQDGNSGAPHDDFGVRARMEVPRGRRPYGGVRLSDILAAALGLVLVSWTAVLQRDLWFYSDAWTYILREAGSVDGLLAPHEGHLFAVPIAVLNAMYRLFGLDYWPWHQILRAGAYWAMAMAIWAYLRHRGTGPFIRWSALLVVLVLSQQSWLMAYTFANPLVHATVVVSLIIVDSSPSPGWLRGTTVAVALSFAIASGGSSIAGIAGLIVVAAVKRRWRWFGPLAAPLVAYAVWYVAYRPSPGTASAGLGDQLLSVAEDGPIVALDIVAAGVGRTLAIGTEYWPIAGVLVLGLAVWLVAVGRMGPADLMPVIAATTYIVLLLLARADTGQASTTEIRYTFNISIWLLLLLAPNIGEPRVTRTRILTAGLVGLVLLGNSFYLQTALSDWSRSLTYSRQVTETAGALIAAGEPFDPNAPIEGNRNAVVQGSDLVAFLKDGWRPEASQDPHLRARARAELKLAWSAREPWRGFAPENASELASTSCARVAAGQPVETEIADARTIVVKEADDAVLEIRWQDARGPALRRVEAYRGTSYIRMMEPTGGPADFEMRLARGAAVDVCNLPRSNSRS